MPACLSVVAPAGCPHCLGSGLICPCLPAPKHARIKRGYVTRPVAVSPSTSCAASACVSVCGSRDHVAARDGGRGSQWGYVIRVAGTDELRYEGVSCQPLIAVLAMRFNPSPLNALPPAPGPGSMQMGLLLLPNSQPLCACLHLHPPSRLPGSSPPAPLPSPAASPIVTAPFTGVCWGVNGEFFLSVYRVWPRDVQASPRNKDPPLAAPPPINDRGSLMTECLPHPPPDPARRRRPARRGPGGGRPGGRQGRKALKGRHFELL